MSRIFLSLLICFSVNMFAQNKSTFCNQVSAVKKIVNKQHYKAKSIDDSLSKGVFELFIKAIDPDRDYLMHKDVELFKEDIYKLDDYINNNQCAFISKYSELLKLRIEESKVIISEFKNVELNYSGSDTIRFVKKSDFNFFKNNVTRKRYWNKNVRSKILSHIVDESDNLDSLNTNFISLEKIAREKIIQNELCKFDGLLNQSKTIEVFVEEAFLGAFLQYHDPNSYFFNDTEKTLFDNALSSSELSFGIYTEQKRNGNISISSITPGGSASKQGGFDENDIIKSLTSNDGDVLETLCISNDDINSFLNDYKTITFKIKKENGDIKSIQLTKNKTKVVENELRGYLVGEESFGYINIPSFYRDDESSHGLGLTHDLAKELYKLQKEEIKGLILDLRFNGGGSMREAAELSGMFIDRGPLAILKYNNQKTFTLRDSKRGTFFNKPIVILINNYSASASEFFASVMQDYNRAIIVGSTTHGKSSAQAIMPLSDTEDLGYCKITVETFYRVTGKSHQSEGVIPDIFLPSTYDGFKTTEKYEKYALKNDTVNITLKHKPYSKINIESLANKSHQRVDSTAAFKLTKRVNAYLLDNYFGISKSYPLNLERVLKRKQDYNNTWNSLFKNKDEKKNYTIISIKNTKSTTELLEYNAENKEANATVLKDLSESIYIKEASYILKDYINSILNN